MPTEVNATELPTAREKDHARQRIWLVIARPAGRLAFCRWSEDWRGGYSGGRARTASGRWRWCRRVDGYADGVAVSLRGRWIEFRSERAVVLIFQPRLILNNDLFVSCGLVEIVMWF